MSDPYAPPNSELAAPAKSSREVELLRTGQKLMLYAILLNIITTGILIVYPELVALAFVQLGVFVLSIVGMVKLFQGFHTAMWARVLMILSLLVPLINLLVLLRLNSRATRELRAAGYKVGLMGASRAPSHVTGSVRP